LKDNLLRLIFFLLKLGLALLIPEFSALLLIRRKPSMQWSRIVTYGFAAACGALGLIFPVASPVLFPLATAIGGWATTHPADANNLADANARANTATTDALIAANKKK
jgi:hypothetical protein